MKNLKNALLLKHLYQLRQLGYTYTSITLHKTDEPKLTLPNNLVLLKKQAHDCHLCTLSKRRQKVVFGEGNPHAKLMIVGDVPSDTDDYSGKIMTGRSGELLSKMIENVLMLKREDIYITNLLKCKAIDNQMPSSVYTHSCYPYLLKEIELVKPKVILTLGTLPYEYITGDTSALDEVRGIIHTQESYILIPTYHPNYLLRNPSAKREVFEDLLKLKSLLV